MNTVNLVILGGVVLGLAGAAYIFYRLRISNKSPIVKTSSLQNEKLKSDIILNAIEDGVILIDSSNIIRVFNPAAERITGWKQNDAINLDYNVVLKFVDRKGDSYPEGLNPIGRVLREGQVIRDNEVELLTSSQKHLPIFISSSPLMSGEKNIDGVVSVFRDVSKERGEESQRAEFISTASHEMRTPVAAIEGYLALATNDAVCQIDSKAREYLEKAHSSTQHLGKLFQDLLTAAKSEDGRLSNHPVVTDMAALMQEVADDVKFTASKKGLLVDFIIGSEHQTNGDNNQDNNGFGSANKQVHPIYYAHVDPDRMREVITNLFDNAVKYTDQGKITLAVTGDDKIVQLRVSDTGAGIPSEDIPHLFQKFYRVDNSTTRTIGGTGLGLFISRKIVELYQGRVWAESELGKGSTFYINLPRISSEKALALQAEEAATGPATPVPVGGKI